MKKIALFLSALLLLASCSKPGDGLDPMPSINGNEISFTNGGIKFTRVSNGQFDNGDVVTVRAFEQGAEYDQATYSYSAPKFTSSEPIKISEKQELSYQAIYPSDASFVGVHNIFADQSNVENYEQSDLLVATVEATDSPNPELVFRHVMSSIILNVKVLDNGEAVSDADLDVTFNLKSAANVDVNDESYTATGDALAVTPYSSVGNGSSEVYNYSLITAPQIIAANSVIATVIVNSADKFQFTQIKDLEIESSKRYFITYTVDITTKESSVEFNGSIVDWEDVTPENPDDASAFLMLADFSATEYPTEFDRWVIGDKTATTDDFVGLKDALTSISSSGREISLSFPNLEAFPKDALDNYYNSGYKLNTIVSIEAEVAASIGESAFRSCDALTTVSLPSVTSIGVVACLGCAALTTVSLPAATSIGGYAFLSCAALTTVSLPTATSIGEYAFADCAALTTISLPVAISIEDQTFRSCTALTTVSLPAATSIGSSTFRNCTALTTVSLPAATSIGSSAFRECTALTKLELATESKLEDIVDDIFDYIDTNNIDLTIGSQNEGVDVEAKMWNDYIFKSITVK